jgi:predicted transcriptional regulator
MIESQNNLTTATGRAGLNGSTAQAVAQVAAAFAARNTASVDEIVALAERLVSVFVVIDAAPVTAAGGDVTLSFKASMAATAAIEGPAIPIENAVSEDKVFCLCCGRGFTMLKRHLKAEHGLLEEDYRALFNLPEDMVLVAPSYSARKAAYAKRVGLGKYSRDQTDQERTTVN